MFRYLAGTAGPPRAPRSPGGPGRAPGHHAPGAPHHRGPRRVAVALSAALDPHRHQNRDPAQERPPGRHRRHQGVIADQRMQSMADVVRYIPGVTMGQGEGNRDQPTIRGNSTTAGFFVDGSRDDVQYFRDLYNVERVEALKGANALIFGRGVGGGALPGHQDGGVDADPRAPLQGGSFGNRRTALDVGEGVSDTLACASTAMYENSDLYRDRWASSATASIPPRRSGWRRHPSAGELRALQGPAHRRPGCPVVRGESVRQRKSAHLFRRPVAERSACAA